MNRTQKEQSVSGLSEKLKKTRAIILAEYRGLKVSELTDLRRGVRDSEGEMQVVKNRLAKRSLVGSPFEALAGDLKGPIAIVLANGDPVLLAKTVSKFVGQFELLKLKGGFLAGKKLTAADVDALAKLPSKEELYAKLLGTLMAPITGFVRVLNAVPSSLARVVSEIGKTKGGSDGNS